MIQGLTSLSDMNSQMVTLKIKNAWRKSRYRKILVSISGEGSGPIEAFVNAMVETLNEPISVRGYHEHALGKGSDASAICVLAIDGVDSGSSCYGIGISRNTITASLNAIISALNRKWAQQ